MRRWLMLIAAVEAVGIAVLLWKLQRVPEVTVPVNPAPVRVGHESRPAWTPTSRAWPAARGAPVRAARMKSSRSALPAELPSVPAEGDPATVAVAGRVEDERTGEGVAGVEVDFGRRTSAVSGEDGRFHLTLAPGLYPVSAAGAHVLSAHRQRAVVKGGMAELVIRVMRTATVSGRMITAGGAPVTDGTVSFRSDQDGRRVEGLYLAASVGQAFTGPDGRFQLEVVPGTVTVVGRAPAGRAQSRAIQMKSGASHHVELVVPAPVRVVGRVRDARGAPVADATVHLHPYGKSVPTADFRVTTTDQSGRYRIDDAFPGTLAIEARADGVGYAPPVVITLAAGTTRRQNLTLAPRRSIRGRVVLDGRGLATRVRAHRGKGRIELETRSDESGRFSLDGLAPGRYWLELDRPDGSSVLTRTIHCPAAGLVFDLARPGRRHQ